jgi:UDP-GlcNAc:undecaprenyl-phosphate/decaprenyl-phosphate GlcNAc-1-phosphate transferase
MEILIPSFTAFVVTVLITPLVIKFAYNFKLVDDPQKRPHPAHAHQKTIPRAGGLAIYIGIVVAGLIFMPENRYLIGALAGISLLLIMGLIDDRLYQFNPYIRLILLFLAAGIVVGSGVGISFISNPLYGLPGLSESLNNPIIHLDQIIIPWGSHKIILLADLLALFWIVSLTQIINWSKGVDGQMPGIALIAALVLGIFSLKLFYQGDPNQLGVAKLSFIVAGTALGFLLYNWYPAKIIPGFSGSTILAYMLAVLSILSGAKIATALLVLAIPTVDFIYTFCRRVLSGKSPVWPDRRHLHHRLLDLGWSHSQISLFYILGSVILGAVALSVNTESKLLTVVVVAIFFGGFVLWLNSLGDLSKPPGHDNG